MFLFRKRLRALIARKTCTIPNLMAFRMSMVKFNFVFPQFYLSSTSIHFNSICSSTQVQSLFAKGSGDAQVRGKVHFGKYLLSIYSNIRLKKSGSLFYFNSVLINVMIDRYESLQTRRVFPTRVYTHQ
jgi:hypothetical protein